MNSASKKIKNIFLTFFNKTFSIQKNETSNFLEKKKISSVNEKNIQIYKNAKLFYDLFDVTFHEKYYPILNPLKIWDKPKTAFFIFKTYYLAYRNSNFLDQKKLMHIFCGKISFNKSNILKYLHALEISNRIEVAHKQQNDCVVEDSVESASINVFYEILAMMSFARTQPSVYGIKIKSERPSLRNLDEQKLSQKMTGQKNCDLEITFKTKINSFFKSLLDIKIGERTHYKGNLIFTHLGDIDRCYKAIHQLKTELGHFLREYDMSDTEIAILKESYSKIEKIEKINNITPQNKIVLIQEEIIQIKQIVRNYNPFYNPNFIVFIPENTTLNKNFPTYTGDIEVEVLLEKFAQISEVADFTQNSTDSVIQNAISKSLFVYLSHKKICLEVMSPSHREFCLSIIKNFLPDYVQHNPIISSN